ncbi:hypothetical protein L7F22_038452 [Adiantum nelumboides]|nr:hypothetical protein [Adiantum nelumboides]
MTKRGEKLVALEPLETCDVRVHLINVRPAAHQVRVSRGSLSLLSKILDIFATVVADETFYVVGATSSLLSKIPYFAAGLSEHWKQQHEETISSTSDPKQIIALSLHCAAQTSPQDYVACFKFLTNNVNDMQMESVSAAVRIMRCADHTLFQECAEQCMAYLAAMPWSDKEEVVIRDAVSLMGLPPSSDLCQRLHPDKYIDGPKIFKDLVTDYIVRSQSFSHRQLEALVKDALTKPPSELVSTFYVPTFIEVWSVLSRELIQYMAAERNGSCTWSLAVQAKKTDKWICLTRVLARHAQMKAKLAKVIALNSPQFSTLILAIQNEVEDLKSSSKDNLAGLVTSILEGAIPAAAGSDPHATGPFLLNSERASLVAMWAPVAIRMGNYKKLQRAFTRAVIANGPFEKWEIDAMGPLLRTANGKLYILVAIDYMTRFGTPLEIVSDNGPGFRRGLLTEPPIEQHGSLEESLEVASLVARPGPPQ